MVYKVEYSKSGKEECKNTRCHKAFEKGELRLGKVVGSSPKSVNTHWYHVGCMFDSLRRARKASKKISGESDLKGFDQLNEDDQKKIREYIVESKLPPRKRKELLPGAPDGEVKKKPKKSPKKKKESSSSSSDSSDDEKEKKKEEKKKEEKKKEENKDEKKKDEKKDSSSSSSSEEEAPKKRKGRPPKAKAPPSPKKSKKDEKKDDEKKDEKKPMAKKSKSSSTSSSSSEDSDDEKKDKKKSLSQRRKKLDPSKLLKELNFCLSGDLMVDSKTIREHGGVVSSNINQDVDYLLSNEEDVKKESSKVKKAVNAEIPVLRESYIEKSIANGKPLPIDEFKLA